MPIQRLRVAVASAICLAVGLAAGPATATAATPVIAPSSSVSSPGTSTNFPQTTAADQGARWLAAKLSSQGFIPSPTTGQANLSFTANTVLALAATGIDIPGAQLALTYLEAHVDDYVTVTGTDGPGQLSLLILDAHALGVDPTNFGGTNLVTRLVATERTSGTDAGLFGAQDPTFDGAYRQGLALAALAAVGDTSQGVVGSAITWLRGQQCPDGGWTSYITTANPCDGDPASFAGPDTNSTALAIQGLASQSAVTSAISTAALGFLTGAQNPDGGWGYEPNATTAPGSSDSNSTALVVQALVALGQSPLFASFQHGSATPISSLLSFQVSTGPDTGGFVFQANDSPDILSTVQAVPALAGVVPPFIAASAPAPTGGYWLVAADGGIFSFGDAGFHGSKAGSALNKPIVGMAATPDGKGYWEVASDGGIFSFGDAAFFGSTGAITLNKPIVGMAATSDGKGYWLVAADGGIFSFGDASFHGSTGAIRLNKPVVGMAGSPDGGGYWLVASDGGIFSFGDAQFFGSTGTIHLNQPMVGMAGSPDGKGYWSVASDGGIFAFGDAAFFGSTGAIALNRPVVGMSTTADGHGYRLVASDGGIFSFGDATYFGSMGGNSLASPVVAMAVSPDGVGG